MIHRTPSVFWLAAAGLWLVATSCGPKVSIPEVPTEPTPPPAPSSSAPTAAVAATTAAAPRQGAPATEAVAPGAGVEDEVEVPTPEEATAARLAALARALGEAEVSALEAAPFEQPCSELEGAAALALVQQRGAAQLCALGNRPAQCAPARGKPAKQRQALCAAVRAGAATPLAAPLEAALAPLLQAGWQAQTRLARGAAPVLELRDLEGEVHAMVGGGGWRRVIEPVALVEGGGGMDQLWPAPGLGHGASHVAVATSSMGGSESGEQTTWLFVLCEQGPALRICGRKIIGRLVWAFGPGERARSRGGARSLAARPHLAVTLAPKLEGAELRLARAESTLPAKLRSRFSPPVDECPDGAKACGPWAELTALREEAGAWRFDGSQLVRAK